MDQQEEKNNENKNNKRNNCLILYQNTNCAYTFRPVPFREKSTFCLQLQSNYFSKINNATNINC